MQNIGNQKFQNKWIHVFIWILAIFIVIWQFLPEIDYASYVKSHEEELTQIALQVIENGSAEGIDLSKSELSKIQKVTYWNADYPIVEFSCKKRFLSKSDYIGFYYSVLNEPVGFQGESVDLIIGTQGWSWYREDGAKGNTSKIMDYWYTFHSSL